MRFIYYLVVGTLAGFFIGILATILLSGVFGSTVMGGISLMSTIGGAWYGIKLGRKKTSTQPTSQV